MALTRWLQDEASWIGCSDPDIALVLESYAAFARGDIDAAERPLHPTWSGSNRTSFHWATGGAVAEYLRVFPGKPGPSTRRRRRAVRVRTSWCCTTWWAS